jgi:hypothetical protein
VEYRKGDRVRHPARQDWGLGEVLADSHAGSLKVFFVGVGEKTLALQHVQPIKVSGSEAAHPVLDNLKIGKSAAGIKYQSLPESIQFFLREFPEGFFGKKFNEQEREYKAKAHTLALELLGKETFAELLHKGNYEEVARRALKLVNATNLIFPNEKMALKDGLANKDAQRQFAEALYEMLFGQSELESRLESFFRVLEEIRSAKWTTATYFLFVMHPDKFMFVKPTVTQYAAELCGFEINYLPQPNWRTYRSVLSFAEYLLSELRQLRPRDMIDVQSFMWCIAPGTYQGS